MSNEIKKHEFLFYTSPSDEKIKISIAPEEDTVWATQKQIADIFGVARTTITGHLTNIFKEEELSENSVSRKFRHTAPDGKSYNVKHYNLDAIISVGYRVNSYQATHFRKWATGILKEYLIKGFAMDDERLKQGQSVFGKDYFDELLERIKEIRNSEKRLYYKVTNIFALAVDYDRNSPIAKDFFATVQNKLHWAITGQTAAELIHSKADASKENMGLSTWQNAPKGQITKRDTEVAKNYLDEPHIKELNGLVSAYLDLAQNRAERQILMNMQDWVKFLNDFLALSNYPILENKGKISSVKAKLKAAQEFETFKVRRDKELTSDFDEAVEQMIKNSKKH